MMVCGTMGSTLLLLTPNGTQTTYISNIIKLYTMIFNKHFLPSSILMAMALALFFSCEKQENPAPHGYSWAYMPRDCNYLNIWDSYVDSSLYFQLSEKERNDLLKKDMT